MQHEELADLGLYADPLVYDVLHWPGTRDEVDGLEAIESQFVSASGSRLWLEPACGTGRYLREAARRGIPTVGFDASSEMISFARERAASPRPDAALAHCEFLVADMTSFAQRIAKPVTFAFNPINTIRHLDTDEQVIQHLKEMSQVLAPGGAYAIGLSATSYEWEQPSEDTWEGRRGSLGVRQIVQYIPPTYAEDPGGRSETVCSHVIIERGSNVEHRDATYRLRTYDAAQWRALVDRSPMRIVATVDEGAQAVDAADGSYAIYVLESR